MTGAHRSTEGPGCGRGPVRRLLARLGRWLRGEHERRPRQWPFR